MSKLPSDLIKRLSTARDNSLRETIEDSSSGNTRIIDYSYDNDGFLKSKTEIDGQIINQTINQANPSNQTNPSSQTDGQTDDQTNPSSQTDDQTNNQPRTTTYSYGTLGELRSVVLPDNTTIRYYQNANNQRSAKEVNGTIVQRYLWLDNTTLLGFYDQEGNFGRFTYAADRTPIQMDYKGAVYYLSYNRLGSLKAIRNQSNRTIRQIDYDSFGTILTETNPTIGTTYQDLSLDDLSVPLGFGGGLYDRDTGLVRFGYRDYDPSIGRWTAKDPIDFNGGQGNLYVYVGDDPINYIDPTGEVWWWFIGGVASAAGNLIGMAADPRGNYSYGDYARAAASGFAVGTVSAGIGSVGIVGGALKTGWALVGIGADVALQGLIGIDGAVDNNIPTMTIVKSPSACTEEDE